MPAAASHLDGLNPEQRRAVEHGVGAPVARPLLIIAGAALYALEHHIDRLADDHANARRLADGLTAREVEVLKLIAIGRSNKDISLVLSIRLCATRR